MKYFSGSKAVQNSESGYRSLLSAKHRKIMLNGCTDFIVSDLRPMYALEGEGLRSLLSSFSTVHMAYQPVDLENASYFLPSRHTVGRNIGVVAKKIKDHIKEELRAVFARGGAGGSISLDIWTDEHRHLSYMCVIAHYINDKFEMCQRVLANEYLASDISKDNVYILSVVKKILSGYDIDIDEARKRMVYVTDRGPNILKALSSYNHITCALHFLSNTVKRVFEDGRPEELLGTCKAVVRYIKKSGKAEQFDPSLKSSSDIRWNFAIVMMRSIVAKNNWDKLCQVLEESERMDLLGEATKEELELLIGFLEVFYVATKAMETTSKPTITFVLPWFHKIERCMESSPNDSAIIQAAKKNVQSYFLMTKMEFKNYLASKYHLMSNVLHPAMKGLVKFLPSEKEKVMREVILT